MDCKGNDLDEWLCLILQKWQEIQSTEAWEVGLLVVAALGSIYGFLKGVGATIGWWRKWRERRTAQALAEKTSVRSFTDEEISNALRHYIIPYCSNIDPSNQEDLRVRVGVKEPIFDALESELSSSGGKRHIMVLADSGMGKTTLLLNLFAREQRKRQKAKRKMALVPLSRDDAVEQMKRVEKPRETILLLDAFDEDSRAIANYQQRMVEVMREASDYKAVIMTCRTQFFTKESKIPRETGIIRVGPRRAGTPGSHEWRTVYLLPFDEKQVTAFLSATIPWWRLRTRHKARKIVRKIPELAVRPMLLALVPDLASLKAEAQDLWELYVFMVESWLVREKSWISPDDLMRLSKLLAVNLVLGREKRKSERISLGELMSVLSLSSESIDGWKLTNRSLLNRDAAGNYKFAHRSIMEFMFIRAFIDGDDKCVTVTWTDMMCDLFLSWGRSDLVNRERAFQILSMDLRKTALFPLAHRPERASSIDQQWVKDVFSGSTFAGERYGFPPEWRTHTSHINERQDLVRVYELAEGLVWQVTKTIAMQERGEREVFLLDRFATRWRSKQSQRVWGLPQLSEMRALVEVLAASGKLAEVLDEREVYWLADADDQSVAVARVRSEANVRDEPPALPNFQLVHSVRGFAKDVSYAMDVYKAPLRGAHVSKIRAMAIFTYQGEADAIWHRDAGGTHREDWGMELMVAH